MKAYILTIGDEILIGQVTDSNATYMAARLSEAGYQVIEHLSVADSRQGIMYGLDRATEAADLILVTGGLGPTRDDVTKNVLADYFDCELTFHEATWNRLTQLYRRLGRRPNKSHRQQCHLPEEADVLTNERGTAPGLWMERGSKVVVAMPGVPYEMRYLMEQEVMPRLLENFDSDDKTRSITLLTAGEGESNIAERIAPVEDSLPDHITLAYLPSLGTVRIRITTRGEDEERMQAELEDNRQQLENLIGDLIYGYGDEELAAAVGRRLAEAGQTLVTAESCTGGNIARLLTAHPGSSDYFLGGAVTYSNQMKKTMLGVRLGTIKKHGAVSEATVREMAEGALKKLGGDYAIAVSGIAGPGGGSKTKPVGTVWIAVASQNDTEVKLLRAGKDRERNITYASVQALNVLRRLLDGLPID